RSSDLLAWAIASGAAGTVVRSRPVRVAAERELEQFVARVATFDDEAKIAERLGALWRSAIAGCELTTLWWRDGDSFVNGSRERWAIDSALATWFVHHSEALAMHDLATMKVGPIRAQLEAIAARRREGRDADSGVVVPLIDRDELVGIVEAQTTSALRESERGLLADSARAA